MNEHSHETGGAWYLTQWVVPDCPACNPESLLEGRRLRAARLRAEALTEALSELVSLKDGPRDADYERRKPSAWARARELLEGSDA